MHPPCPSLAGTRRKAAAAHARDDPPSTPGDDALPATFRTPAAASPARAAKRVFVSYSSHDLAHVQDFLGRIGDLKRDHGLEVFHERSALFAGDSWDGKIMSAVNDCDVFLFFVSPQSLLSNYCAKELATAFDRQRTGRCTLVPVLLKYVDWNVLEQPRPGCYDALASLVALPDRKRFVDTEGLDRGAMWDEVVAGLGRLLAAPRWSLPPPPPPRRLQPTFLPYLCDQTDCDIRIHRTLKRWCGGSQALVVLLRAPAHACPMEFVQRIETRRLDLLLRTLPPGCELAHDYGLAWPDEAPVDAGTPDSLLEYFRDKIKESIGQPYVGDDRLAKALSEHKRHWMYAAELRRMSPAWFRVSVQAFSRTLRELAPAAAPLRLAALLWSEDADIQSFELAPQHLCDGADGLVADIPPMDEHFGIGKVLDWSRTNEVRDVAELSEESLRREFADLQDRITMKEFAQRIGDTLLRRAGPDDLKGARQ